MTTLNIYKTYSFRNKDPVIDKLRTIKKDEGFTDTEIHNISGISTTTLYNWFKGKTRRPQHAAIMAVAHAMGYEYQLTKDTSPIIARKRQR